MRRDPRRFLGDFDLASTHGLTDLGEEALASLLDDASLV